MDGEGDGVIYQDNFWARIDMDPRNSLQGDFWLFWDAINAENCKFAFSEALKRMYDMKHDLNSLPPIPEDGHMVCHAELGLAYNVLPRVYDSKDACGCIRCTNE